MQEVPISQVLSQTLAHLSAVALLTVVGGATAVALVLTLPLTLVYLALCYTDETGPVRIEVLQRAQLPT